MAINIKPSHRGRLHKDMGVPQGKKIPASSLAALAKSGTPAERKQAQFAINARKWRKG